VAVTGAMAVAVPPPSPPAPVDRVADVRLAADPVPAGGLLTSFLGNQAIYCSIICLDVVKLVVTVPAGALAAPVAFVQTLPSGNVFKAVGSAAASVTNPLDAAFDPIITNDLNLVLPRAQNTLEVAVVGLLNIASSTPLDLPDAVQAARQSTFDALNDTIPPTLTSPNPHGLVQVVAVEAIEVASSVAFQAFEEGLLGVVQTADAGATTLAHTGDPVAAATAGAQAAQASATKSLNYIVTAVDDAVTNISAVLHDPTSASTREQAPVVVDAKGVANQTMSRTPTVFRAPRTVTQQADTAPAKRPFAALGKAVRQAITPGDTRETPRGLKAMTQSKAGKEPGKSRGLSARKGHDRSSAGSAQK
jgi:hypothetical protein